MEEKERYIIDRFDEDIFDTKKEYYPSNQTICEIINKQDKRIKELQEKLCNVYDRTNENLRFARDNLQKLNKENQHLKQQLADMEESYNKTMAYLNIIRTDLLNLPKKIVEEIRDDMSKRIMKKQIKWKDNIQIGFICNAINECLDTILKKYGEEDE